MRKKILSAMLSLTMLCTALSGCGSSAAKEESKAPEQNSSEAKGSEEKAEANAELEGDITFWHSFTQGPRLETIQEAADKFMEEHPKVTIKIETFSWNDFYTKWTTGLASGNVPDMSTALVGQVSEMINSDAIIPLNGLIDDIGRNKFYENALNELSPYGIIEYGKSDLKLEYNRNEYDNGNFHDLLFVLGNDKDSMGLKKTDVDDICSNLRDYYIVTSGGFECVDVDHKGVLTMCDDDQTLDDFHVKPFMIKLSPDLAKKYLCYADNGEYVDTYKYYDFDGIVDDKSHSVYLTSIAGYDTDGYSFDDATYIGSDNALYSGYYFDGYSFVKTRLALTDAASEGKFDLSKYIYNSLDEANYVEDELLNCKDIDELRTKVKNRQDELRRLAIMDSSFSKEDARILNYVYGAYLSNQERNFDLPIDYEHEQLTDAELHGKKVNSFDIPDVAEDDKSSEQEYD